MKMFKTIMGVFIIAVVANVVVAKVREQIAKRG